jgi:hypothetical protein
LGLRRAESQPNLGWLGKGEISPIFRHCCGWRTPVHNAREMLCKSPSIQTLIDRGGVEQYREAVEHVAFKNCFSEKSNV